MRLAAKFLLSAICLSATAWGADGKPRVTLELLTRPGLPLTAPQQWSKALGDLGVSGVQIHSAGPNDEMGVTQQGPANYKVVGILAADNMLYLPRAKFSLQDTARLRKWLDSLSDEGPQGVTEKRSAFGLTGKQLEQVNDDLKKIVVTSTQDLGAGKVVDALAAGLKFSVQVDPTAQRALARAKVADELRGLSTGTALAAAARSAGLALEPERPRGGELQYRIGMVRADHEAWPVGWKPKGKPNEALPALFDFLNVEIKDTSAAEALAAIEGRLDVPFLYDRKAMAAHGVDPAKSPANVPSKRMTYSLILNKVLLQAKLKYELRVDEADKPFLWITTIKPVP